MRRILVGVLTALAVTGCGSDSAPSGAREAIPAQDSAVTAGVATSAAATPAAASNPRGLPPGAIRVEPSVIVDATGFEAPMAAYTLFLPAGWKATGGVLWGQAFTCTNGYNVEWSATSPDGATSVHVLPQAKWEANNYGAPASSPGCPLASYANVQQFIGALLQGWRPDARPQEFRRRADIEKELAQANRVTPMPMGEARTWVEAGELAFTIGDRRGSVAAAVVFSLMRTNAGMGMQSMDAMTGFALPAWAVTAPASQFDAGFFEAIRRSIKPNPQWERRIAGHNNAIGRVAIDEARKRSRMIAESNAEISRIRQEAWDASQESADRRVREFGEVIKGVETYDDGNAPGGQVELSYDYSNAWRLNDGSYVLTNDASFEPWRDLGVEGSKLEVTR